MEVKLASSVVWHQLNPKAMVVYLLSYQGASTPQKTPTTEQKHVHEGHNLYTLRGFSLMGAKHKPDQFLEIKDLPMHFISATGGESNATKSPAMAPPSRTCKNLIVCVPSYHISKRRKQTDSQI